MLNHLLTQSFERHQSLAKLKFPFSTLRQGQKEMMLKVLQHLQSKEALLLQAPTGIGKTLGTLFPALKALNKRFITHIFYATAKHSTRLVVEEALQLLRRQSNVSIQSITLSPQELLCPHHELRCQPSYVPPLHEMEDTFLEAIQILLKKPHINKEDLIQTADLLGLCAYELSQAVLPFCDVIIGDYNHIFDPKARLKYLLNNKKYTLALLIDEAHNLPSRAKEMFSSELSFKDFYLLSKEKDVFKNQPVLYHLLEDWENYFKSLHLCLKEDLDDQPTQFCKLEPPLSQHHLWAFNNFRATDGKLIYLSDLIKQTEKTFPLFQLSIPSDEKFNKIYTNFKQKIESFYFLIEKVFKKGYFIELEKKENNLYLRIKGFDFGDELFKAYQNRHVPIFFSASLDPLHYYHRSFSPQNISKSDFSLSVARLESPFPSEHFCVLMSTYLKTDFENRALEMHKLLRSIKLALLSKKGNAIIYFPSYRYMKNFIPYLMYDEHLSQVFHFVIQKEEESLEARKQFIDAFTTDFENNPKAPCTLGLAILGGSYGEGIDLEGNKLRGVIIIGLGLPYPTFSTELERLYLENQEEDGYNFVYRYPGFNKLIQAAGRVIRTEEDKGFVLFCDSRLQAPVYQALWPQHWYVQWVQSEKDLLQRLKAFEQGKFLANDSFYDNDF